jgi:hypothetical protein
MTDCLLFWAGLAPGATMPAFQALDHSLASQAPADLIEQPQRTAHTR